MQELIDRLEKMRKEKEISQEEVAAKLDVSVKTYWNWVNNKSKPAFDNTSKINSLLKVIEAEYVHCRGKGLSERLRNLEEDPKEMNSCPICGDENCNWEIKEFDELFDLGDVSSYDQENGEYYVT